MRFQVLIRLFPAVLLFLTASLAVLRAPTHLLWMLAIGVTEWGYFLALVCLGAAVPLWNNTWYGRTAGCLCAAAAILVTTPMLRAAWIAGDIQQQIHKTFGNVRVHRPRPMVFADLFLGLSPPDVQPQKRVYRNIEGSDLSLDFYSAQDSKPAPLIVVIHDTRAKLTDYLGGSPSAFPANYEAASPVRRATSASPPVLLLHGGRDEIVAPDHSRMLTRRLTELGVPNLYVALPWATHGFDYLLRGPGSQISIYAIESFLGSVLDQHG